MFIARKFPKTRLKFNIVIVQSTEAITRGCFIKVAVLKNFAIFTRKHLCWSHFKVAGLKAYNVINKTPKLRILRLQHKCLPVNIAKFLRRLFQSMQIVQSVAKTLGKIFFKVLQLFKWLFLKVQHFHTQLKRGCFFENLQKSYISQWLLQRLTISVLFINMSYWCSTDVACFNGNLIC